MKNIKITSEKLSVQECEQHVSHDGCGGIVVFIGTVRNSTKGKAVKGLEFECYEKMAVKELDKIADHAIDELGALNVAIHHRTGAVPIGEEAVVIAVSSAHRKAAFEACEFAIDTLKVTVPIWKKELFEDGEVWVSAHP
ncbi:MAG: molybdenum cofactor biosynthesis protein MoaE [Cyclobacteriaceae bacterium]